MLPNPQIPADMVTFAEEIIYRKIHFWGSEMRFFFFFFEKKSTEKSFK